MHLFLVISIFSTAGQSIRKSHVILGSPLNLRLLTRVHAHARHLRPSRFRFFFLAIFKEIRLSSHIKTYLSVRYALDIHSSLINRAFKGYRCTLCKELKIDRCTQNIILQLLEEKIWNASRICVSSLRRGHANLLCIVPILVYVLPLSEHVYSVHQTQYILGCIV